MKTVKPEVDIAWAAGFLEGEGSFELVQKPTKNPGPHGTIRISVEQTQIGPLERLQATFGGKIYGPYQRKPRYVGGMNIQPLWIYRVGGETARDLALAVLPYMFERRREKINFILSSIPATITRGTKKGGKDHPSVPIGSQQE